MTSVNDIVLIYFEDEPFTFARIEDINADYKKNWYHVKLLLLQIPLETVTWILRDVYIDGEEFTMNGKRMRFEKITCPEEPPVESREEEDGPRQETGGEVDRQAKVISFADLKKRG